MIWKNNTTSKKPSSTDKGNITERFAESYLNKHGLTSVENNYHSRQGEIDLIMRDGETYVFIEVKYRKNMNFGGAISAIPASKQKKIKHCITFYLHQLGLNEYNTPCRIDVVALVGDITKPQVTWLMNAF